MAAEPCQLYEPLVEELFAATEDEGAWQYALAHLGDALRADLIAIHDYDHGERAGVLTPVRGLDPDYLSAYRDHYAATNVWMLHGRKQMRPGALTLSHCMYPDDLLPKSEWYNDWLRPQCLFHSMGVVVKVESCQTSTLIFVRQRCQGNYADAEQTLLRRLGPHVERTMRLRRRLAQVNLRKCPDAAVLDQLPYGVLLLDGTGEVLAANGPALEILAEGDGLALSCLRLSAALPADRQPLLQAIAAVLGPHGHARSAGQAMKVGRRTPRRPLELWLAPAGGAGATNELRAVVFVTDPERAGAVSEAAVRSLYGLTPAEARVATALAMGGNAQQIAAGLRVSLDTVRSHIRSLLRRTGAARQTELVERLLGGVAALVAGGPGTTTRRRAAENRREPVAADSPS